LEEDVSNNLHTTMTAYDLYKTREAYMEFPKKVFAKRVYNEVTKQKGKDFWVNDRNKKAMKKHVKKSG
jgi:hypothetical protein